MLKTLGEIRDDILFKKKISQGTEREKERALYNRICEN